MHAYCVQQHASNGASVMQMYIISEHNYRILLCYCTTYLHVDDKTGLSLIAFNICDRI